MRIIHPRPELGLQRKFDVEFRDGVATVESLHPERELAFRQHGFVIEPDPDVKAPFQESLGEPIIDLNGLTIAELRELAGDRITIPARVSKAEAVKLVSELPAEPIPGDIDNGDGTFTSPGYETVEMVDGTVVGDGSSIVTLRDDGTATTEG